MSEALKAGARKSRRSMSGSASRSWRRTNAAVRPVPIRIASTRESKPVLRRVFQAEDEREHRDERERRACEIDPAGARVAILGQERRAEDEEQHHHRDGEQEHRAPPEILEQRAAEQRADRGAGRVARDPHADSHRPLVRIMKHVADERECGRGERRARDAESRSRRDQHSRAGRERGDDGGDTKRRRS